MVIRKVGVVLLAFLVGLFLVIASWPYFFYQVDNPTGGMTGNSIKEAIGTFYETSSVGQRIFILSQVLLLIIIIITGFVVVGKFKKREKVVKGDYVVHDDSRRSRTDLDVLYEMLKRRREINMEDAEGAFKVKPEIVLGWFKVLENGNLAEIDYPRFGKPVLRLFQEKKIGNASPKDGDLAQEGDGVEKIENVEKKGKIVSGKIASNKIKKSIAKERKGKKKVSRKKKAKVHKKVRSKKRSARRVSVKSKASASRSKKKVVKKNKKKR